MKTVETTPRKLPRQARSRATVDALLEAAAQVLVEHGYEKTTTARVAERAGVSVGSLYQYFPSKEALVAALIEQHADEMVSVADEALSPLKTASLEEGLKAIIRVAVDTHRISPELHKVLYEQVPRVGRVAEVMDTNRRITELIERFLRAHARELPRGMKPAVAAVVLETALEALSHKAITERQDLLASGVLERELYQLAAGYLFHAER
ncbi:TetR/AcrR family transcriptional regulator [Pyxidicoccus fallax]|uniref:TetR/AcrR family transcriptional regulator n=1 Tax=Pyxidicoccus fallax TaxID=394095 RepID=A0A848LNY7_9BACT|nr:TetR/AcrR family transcriptional regulator [Pyxidicoccus fallax]NMO19389.1 TetR/AcrR family transcriptional regulator [Pyxidicoccus fallax]NPC80239.1 TetR/AcrR family transcriptional regulator [Pyxidicoccus fallax]